MSRVVLNDTELRDIGRPWRSTLRSSPGPLGQAPVVHPGSTAQSRITAHGDACRTPPSRSLNAKFQPRPLGARRLPLGFLRTRTLSFWTTMDSGVTSTWASAIGLSGVGHAPAGARFFAAGGCRSGEPSVAIGSQTDRLNASLAAHRAPRGDLIYYRTEVRRLQAAHLGGTPSDLGRTLEGPPF